MASKVKSLFVCSECGYESVKWYGKCPNCGEWNTMEEQAPVVSGKTGIKSRASIQELSRVALFCFPVTRE